MRIPALLTTMTLVVLSLVGSDSSATSSTYSFSRSATSAPIALRLDQPASETVQDATRFSSAYTDLHSTKCGSGLTKKEEKEAEEHGTDLPLKCAGYGGYFVYISYSACAADIAVQKGEESIHLATQAGDFKQQAVEWRLANGKPFAVIVRAYEYSGTEQCALGGKIKGESLIVKGLKGYEHIDAEVNVKGITDPNAKAREIADKGYR